MHAFQQKLHSVLVELSSFPSSTSTKGVSELLSPAIMLQQHKVGVDRATQSRWKEMEANTWQHIINDK